MRMNHGFSRVLGVIVASCLLVSGFIASPANAAEDIKKSVQSRKIMDERPAVLDENTPSTFSERSNEPVSSVTGVTLGDGYKARTDYISIDQRNTKRDALNAVIKWRKDALNDARIKFKYDGSWKTVPEYLKAVGISHRNTFLQSGRMLWSVSLFSVRLRHIHGLMGTRVLMMIGVLGLVTKV